MIRASRSVGSRWPVPFVALASAVVAFVVTGCTPVPSEQSVNPRHALQKALADEYKGLLDPQGLVHNPVGDATRAPDLYATALIHETSRSLNLAIEAVNWDTIPDDIVREYETSRGIPIEWMSYIASALSAENPPASGFDPESDADLADADEAATRIWLESYAAASLAETAKSRLQTAARTLSFERRLGLLASWRLIGACGRLEVECPVVVDTEPPTAFESVDDILAARAAAELDAAGQNVPSWSSDASQALASSASEMIDATEGGREVEVTNLARFAFLADGRSDAFERYLERSAPRVDPETNLYLTHSKPVGTVGNTYTAMMTLGEYFPDLVVDRPTLPSVEDALLRMDESDHVGRLHALAIISKLRPLSDDERRAAEAIAEQLSGTLDASKLTLALGTLEPLVQLGIDLPKDLRIEPFELTTENEIVVSRLVGYARDGILANSDEVKSFYASHLDAVKNEIVEVDVDHPAFLARLLLASFEPDQIDATRAQQLADTLARRIGCEGTAHMVRVSSSPDSPCELNSTRLAVASGVAIGEFGGIL